MIKIKKERMEINLQNAIAESLPNRKYNPGDKVEIKNMTFFNLPHFLDKFFNKKRYQVLDKCYGKTATIKTIRNLYGYPEYIIDLDNEKYIWTERDFKNKKNKE